MDISFNNDQTKKVLQVPLFGGNTSTQRCVETDWKLGLCRLWQLHDLYHAKPWKNWTLVHFSCNLSCFGNWYGFDLQCTFLVFMLLSYKAFIISKYYLCVHSFSQLTELDHFVKTNHRCKLALMWTHTNKNICLLCCVANWKNPLFLYLKFFFFCICCFFPIMHLLT